MLLNDRVRNAPQGCQYGCCTTFPPGGPASRQRRRIQRSREDRRWRGEWL